MFLPTNLPTRRKFLERSALGAGSLLLAPLLLDSCTDHTIPPGDTPIIIPPVGDTQINWNDASKKVVVTGLSLIPEVGEILGGLVDILWPSSREDVWGEIKEQVEALVDQKIADNVYQTVSENLAGLQTNLTTYLNYLKTGTKSEILGQWMSCINFFNNNRPHFQSSGNELQLLGLFTQFTNMYLSLLREPLIILRDAEGKPILDAKGNPQTNGDSWGRTNQDKQNDITNLQNAIKDAVMYVNNIYRFNRYAIANAHQIDLHYLEPFLSVNKFDRGMRLAVLDYLDTWPYYDVSSYPDGHDVALPGEIYSDPYGSCDESGPIVLPSPPTQFPTLISVWGWDRIDAVQLTYPADGGPNGVTQTTRMGDQAGGSTQSPHGGVYNLSSNNPITQVRTLYGSYWLQNYLAYIGPVVIGMQLKFNDGTVTDTFGNQNLNTASGIKDTGMLSYPDMALSSIHINGENKKIGSAADCVVYGFKHWQSPAATLKAIQTLYITSPKERSWADYAKAFPELGISAGLITDAFKAARKAYWELMKAKGPK